MLQGCNDITGMPGINFAEVLGKLTFDLKKTEFYKLSEKINSSPGIVLSKKIEESLKNVGLKKGNIVNEIKPYLSSFVYLKGLYENNNAIKCAKTIADNINPMSEKFELVRDIQKIAINATIIPKLATSDLQVNINNVTPRIVHKPSLNEGYNDSDWLNHIKNTCPIHGIKHTHAEAKFILIGTTANEDKWLLDDKYSNEKRKGGKNSYKKYHALKEKIAELCKSEMEIKSFPSARILCERIAEIIENQYPKLLECFYPYKKSKSTGADWRYQSFYNWCNENFKKN